MFDMDHPCCRSANKLVMLAWLDAYPSYLIWCVSPSPHCIDRGTAACTAPVCATPTFPSQGRPLCSFHKWECLEILAGRKSKRRSMSFVWDPSWMKPTLLDWIHKYYHRRQGLNWSWPSVTSTDAASELGYGQIDLKPRLSIYIFHMWTLTLFSRISFISVLILFPWILYLCP